LLFHATTGYSYYENAFEDANIPFVTVAGRGFYDRPEIRDVLNILRALVDLTDDLAMAGLLRSPAFGLTDTALYQLRLQSNSHTHFWAALQGDLSVLDINDQQQAKRALSILDNLKPSVDRVPVAELLKQLIDTTDYRAILAIGEKTGTGGRLWRNIDKLVADAQSSGKVNVRDFLDYIKTINEVGTREGEAPAEANGSVRLMTIHKSKGLEFPVVVLADASREPNNKSESVYVSPDLGLALKMDPPPMLYRLAKMKDQLQNEAEEQRVLYVALTRAQEKLIISGHATPTKKGVWKTEAWTKELNETAQVDINALMGQAGTEIVTQSANGRQFRAWAIPLEDTLIEKDDFIKKNTIVEAGVAPLYNPLNNPNVPQISEEEGVEVSSKHSSVSSIEITPVAIGKMVHKAIELWLFPGNPRLPKILEAVALDEGLAQTNQRESAISNATELLTRFYESPIHAEIESAFECYHEVPYSRMVGDHVENGYIDLLFRSEPGWQVVDFKTDSIYSPEQRFKLIKTYTSQMQKYGSVIASLLDQPAQMRICFLDDRGRVEIEII
jgi:ATP-dependent exoDNAse (exonuclease V) beta subunit